MQGAARRAVSASAAAAGSPPPLRFIAAWIATSMRASPAAVQLRCAVGGYASTAQHHAAGCGVAAR